jgi:hypothetical protein
MHFLSDSAVNLRFDLFAFVENLQYMGVGMLVIFVVIGIIVGTTMLINWLFSEK